MSVQTCIAGRNLPARALFRKIVEGRGHQVSEVANPARCFIDSRPGPQASGNCKIIIAEYAGPETAEMIDFAIERTRIPPKNIVVLAEGGERGLEDVQDLDCQVLRQPLRVAEFVNWVVASERRCGR
jgi:hypothetical protein